jgi:hypothetical protein
MRPSSVTLSPPSRFSSGFFCCGSSTHARSCAVSSSVLSGQSSRYFSPLSTWILCLWGGGSKRTEFGRKAVRGGAAATAAAAAAAAPAAHGAAGAPPARRAEKSPPCLPPREAAAARQASGTLPPQGTCPPPPHPPHPLRPPRHLQLDVWRRVVHALPRLVHNLRAEREIGQACALPGERDGLTAGPATPPGAFDLPPRPAESCCCRCGNHVTNAAASAAYATIAAAGSVGLAQ